MLDGCKAKAQCEAKSCGASSRSGHSVLTMAVPIWPWDQASHGRACHDQDHHKHTNTDFRSTYTWWRVRPWAVCHDYQLVEKVA
jgi:hypothetical protein